MEKKKLVFIRSENREHDSGISVYLVFATEQGRNLAVKQNNITRYIKNFIEGEAYNLFMSFNACQGIEYENVLVFNWAGRIIMRRDESYFEMNMTNMKKPLSEEKLREFTTKFLVANKVMC